MSKKVIFHIGMPRTGTTSIQNFFTQNEIESLSFPKIYKNDEDTGHFHLGSAVLSNASDVLNQIRRVFDESSNDLIFFSSERLISELAQHPIIFKSFFTEIKRSNCEVHVLCFLREVDEFCWSMYLQCVRDEQFKLPFKYLDYYKAVLNKIITDFETLHSYGDLITLSCQIYSPNNLESTIEKYLKDISPSFNSQIIFSKHSRTPSILLHSFFLHLSFNGVKISSRLRWNLIGGDLDGRGFLKTEMPFNSIENDLLHSIKVAAVERLAKSDQQTFFALHNIITTDAGNLKIFDISALNKQPIDIEPLGQYMKYLMENAEFERVNASEVAYIYSKACDFAKGALKCHSQTF